MKASDLKDALKLAVAAGRPAMTWGAPGIGKSDIHAQVAKEMGFDKIVVGLSEGKMGETISGFVSALKKRGLDVETIDETLSTYQAISQMIELNIPKAKRQRSG